MKPLVADPAGETIPRHVSMTSLNRAIAANRPRRALGALVMAGIATLVSVIALTHTPDAGAIEPQQSARAACDGIRRRHGCVATGAEHA